MNIGAIAHKPAGNRHGTIALTGLASSSTSANRRCGGCVWREAWGLDNALAGKCVLTPPAVSTMRGGFKLVATKEHDEFGKTLVAEAWELDLGQQSWQ